MSETHAPGEADPGIESDARHSGRPLAVPRGLVVFVCAFAIVALNVFPLGNVGYLSDDLFQLERVRHISWFEPIVPHHLAPLLVWMYQWANAGLSVEAWHAIALGIHFVNCAAVYWLVSHGLGAGRLWSGISALLIAVAPAGMEAILWAAAFPFLPLLSILLIGIGVVLERIRGGGLGWGDAALLALLQLLGFFVWDWAILLSPMLFVAALLHPERRLRDARPRDFACLLPAAFVWVSGVAGKSLLGVKVGYGLFPIGAIKAVGMLGIMPGMVLFPHLDKWLIVGLGIPVVALLAWAALRHRAVRLLLVLFYVAQLPMFLMGAPTGRYAYLYAAFLFPAVALALGASLRRPFAIAAVALLILVEAGWYVQGTHWWVDASASVAQLERELQEAEADAPAERPIVIVNLPDHHGATSALWPPPIMRVGLEVVLANGAKVFTPAYAARYGPDAPVIVPRSEIAARHPEAVILEVLRSFEGNGERYTVVPFD